MQRTATRPTPAAAITAAASEVTRMCLGMPGRIIEIVDADQCLARAEMSGTQRLINTAILDKSEGSDRPAAVGDWVMVHMGMALERMEPEEADEANSFIDQLAGPADSDEDGEGLAALERMLAERKPAF